MADSKYTFAVGRRKTSTASVRIFEGTDANKINGKKAEEIYTFKGEILNLLMPFKAAGIENMYFTAVVKGGGKSSQLGAVRHGIARALVKFDESYKPALKKEGLLTRDPRMVERKKTGLKKARKAPQFSKR